MTTTNTSTSATMKQFLRLYQAPGRHWVGDGFPVHGMFGYGAGAESRSPFLLMDFAPEYEFKPNTSGRPRGVGLHPHRGFETVSLAYQGSVTHRDSHGGSGTIDTGDVQWMTAGRGVSHSEFHSETMTREGGTFEFMQLWVDLPRDKKMMTPGYQAITKNQIAEASVDSGRATVRVVAGAFGDAAGPAKTQSPMNVFDIRLQPGATLDIPQPEGWTTMVAVLSGAIDVNGTAVASHELVQLTHAGSGVVIKAAKGAGPCKLLFLAGEPLNQPVHGGGPMVMCSEADLRQAFDDYARGKF